MKKKKKNEMKLTKSAPCPPKRGTICYLSKKEPIPSTITVVYKDRLNALHCEKDGEIKLVCAECV